MDVLNKPTKITRGNFISPLGKVRSKQAFFLSICVPIPTTLYSLRNQRKKFLTLLHNHVKANFQDFQEFQIFKANFSRFQDTPSQIFIKSNKHSEFAKGMLNCRHNSYGSKGGVDLHYSKGISSMILLGHQNLQVPKTLMYNVCNYPWSNPPFHKFSTIAWNP